MFCSYPVTDSLDHRARPPLPTPKRSFEHLNSRRNAAEQRTGSGRPLRGRCLHPRGSAFGRRPSLGSPGAGAFPRRVSFPSKKFDHKPTSTVASGIDDIGWAMRLHAGAPRNGFRLIIANTAVADRRPGRTKR
jgi:hypothetical protein